MTQYRVKCKINPNHRQHYLNEKQEIETATDGKFYYLCPECYVELMDILGSKKKTESAFSMMKFKGIETSFSMSKGEIAPI